MLKFTDKAKTLGVPKLINGKTKVVALPELSDKDLAAYLKAYLTEAKNPKKLAKQKEYIQYLFDNTESELLEFIEENFEEKTVIKPII